MPQQQKPTEQEHFEEHVRKILTEPKQDPKYKLWQKVRVSSKKEANQGCIVGYYWQSVAWCFGDGNGATPGWCYVIQTGWDHRHLEEDVLDECLVVDGEIIFDD